MEKLKWTIGVLIALSIIGTVVPGYTDEAIKKVDIEKEKNEQSLGNSSYEHPVREKPLVETERYRESDKESKSSVSEKEPRKKECPPPCTKNNE